MAIVIRHRCQRCGALWEGGGEDGAWIRCASCKALVDFDWQRFFESDAYRRQISASASSAAAGWPKYMAAAKYRAAPTWLGLYEGCAARPPCGRRVPRESD